MPEYPEGIPVIAVQARHRAKPQKAFFILENTVDLIMGKPLRDIQP
jgi:hypothetical protein